MTDKKFYIILDTENDGIYNKETDSFETVNVIDDNIMLKDNNILIDASDLDVTRGHWHIVINEFGKEISDSALMLCLNYDNITNKFKKENGLYIFDDTDINQVILNNIEEIINFSDVNPENIQDVLENSQILKYNEDYKSFFVVLVNIDFEAVDAVKACLSVDNIKNWLKNTYDCNSVNVDDDVTIIVNA